jgi:hydrogenase nickel incorporation protein HypA/HybF
MHEMGIAMQIIEIATSSIPSDIKDVKVEKVNIEIGKLSAIIPETLTFCFNIAIKDTKLAGAELIIEEIPVIALCQECKNRQTITEPVFICQTCKGKALKIISGRELDIKSIEIADYPGVNQPAQ